MDSASASVHRLHNDNGMEVLVSAYGGIIQRLTAPDRHGRYSDVVLGFDSMDGYFGQHPYFGALVGRYANRIANSRIDLGGATYHLTPGRGGHHLHGGNKGFDKVTWQVLPTEVSSRSLRLHHVSEDGDEGYPGQLSVQVDYALSEHNELSISYLATTDKTTVINLSNHSYFNLGASDAGDVLDHIVELNADFFAPVNSEMIPTGELREVTGTAMDLRHPTRIGDRVDNNDEQLDGTVVGKGGQSYRSRSGFCLETQHFPDSPNQPAFPSTVLERGETYRSRTVYTFSCL